MIEEFFYYRDSLEWYLSSEADISLNFPEESISKKPIKTIVENLKKDIGSKTTESSTKLQIFMKEYEKEFKRELNLGFNFAETRVLHMMKSPLTLYALNLNGQVLIELAGLLERYAIIYIEELFKSLRSVPKKTNKIF